MSNTVISLLSSGESGNTPLASALANGELALNFADGIIYYKTATGSLGQFRLVEPSGLDGEIQFNDSGSFGSNASLTFDKDTGVLSTSNVTSDSIATRSYIQFADGSLQFTANAGSGGGGTITVTFGTQPPETGNTVGDQWIDSNSGSKFHFIDDGDTLQWVEFGPTPFLANIAYTKDETDNLLSTKQNTSPVLTTYQNDGVSFRNRIINGNFDIWQRGTSFSGVTNLTYTVDRWVWQGDAAVNGAQIDISRQEFTLGQTEVPDNPQYFVRVEQSVAATGSLNSSFRQRIEYVESLAGQQVTLSFYAKANATHNLGIIFVQNFGTGGTPSPVASTGGGGAATLTTSWQKITRTVTLPSVAGKTKGTSGNDFLMLVLALPNNVINAVDIAQVQLEAGSVATPFERRPYGTELALCQRYLPAFVFDNSTTSYGFVGQCISTTQAVIPLTFQVQARVAPTGISVSSASHFQLTQSNGPGNICSDLVFNQSSKQAVMVLATVSSVLTAGHSTLLGGANTSALLFANGCEL